MMRTVFFVIIFLLAFFSMLLELQVSKSCRKKSLKISDALHAYTFFTSSILWVLTFIKWYLGSDNISLFQSFWDITPTTFYHYVPILLALSAAFPIIFHLIFNVLFKDIGMRIINWSVSFEICSLLFVFLFWGTITNRFFTIIFPICCVISVAISFVCKRDLNYCALAEYLCWLKTRWAIIFLICFINLFYYPNELYLSNIDSFFNSYSSFIIILLCGTLLGFLFVAALFFMLPKNWIDIGVNIIFGIGIGCYVQGMFLNGKLATMQGSPEVWPTWINMINLLMWSIIIIFVVVFGHFRKKAKLVYEYISIFMMLVLSVTIMTLIVQKQDGLSSSHKGLLCDGAMILGEKNNVVMFVLDMTDTKVLEQIIDENLSFVEPLKDFTFYNNCVSVFSHTNSAIPYILTGTVLDTDNGNLYSKYAYEGESTFLKKLYNANIQFDIFTSADYIDESYYCMLDNYSENIKQKSIMHNTISTMWRTSMYRSAPFIFKINYYYYSDNIEAMVDSGQRWSMDNDIYFHNMIKENGLSVEEGSSGVFKLYHMRGSHYPYYLSDNITIDNSHTEVSVYSQTRGAIKIVYEYIDELKKLGLYDDTTIIITADHGAANNTRSCFDVTKNQMNGTCMPILLVKMPGQNGERLEYNSAPVYHGNMLSTILDLWELDYDNIAPRLCDIGENEDVVRCFYDDTVSPTITVNVTGDAHNVDNWTISE